LNADPVPTVCAKLLIIELFLMRNLGSTMPCFDEPIVPMTPGNMRSRGVRWLFVTCRTCGHETEVNADA
jgi:hypothetical protein